MFLRYTIFAFCWSVLVALLCGLPGSGFPDLSFWQLLTFDKAAHAFVYAVFTYLWAVGFAKQFTFHLLWAYPKAGALVLGLFYGVFMEVLQQLVFIERSAEWGDIIANSAGCFIGIGIFSLIYNKILDKRKYVRLSSG